ncbi:hypothetical protein [Nocardiopsis alba]|uniref:hypothetical protein n=1 Tax=Nocardiopsis alba TaxID=53437 RepID=UPI0030B83D9B
MVGHPVHEFEQGGVALEGSRVDLHDVDPVLDRVVGELDDERRGVQTVMFDDPFGDVGEAPSYLPRHRRGVLMPEEDGGSGEVDGVQHRVHGGPSPVHVSLDGDPDPVRRALGQTVVSIGLGDLLGWIHPLHDALEGAGAPVGPLPQEFDRSGQAPIVLHAEGRFVGDRIDGSHPQRILHVRPGVVEIQVDQGEGRVGVGHLRLEEPAPVPVPATDDRLRSRSGQTAFRAQDRHEQSAAEVAMADDGVHRPVEVVEHPSSGVEGPFDVDLAARQTMESTVPPGRGPSPQVVVAFVHAHDEHVPHGLAPPFARGRERSEGVCQRDYPGHTRLIRTDHTNSVGPRHLSDRPFPRRGRRVAVLPHPPSAHPTERSRRCAVRRP